MTTEFKYLDYEGLKLFKEKLEHLRLADKTDIVEVLNEISNGIYNGKLSLYVNGTLLNEFTANQEGNTEANIIVPTELGDLNNSVEFIKNVIKYGQPDVSDLTDDQKESLHNQTSEDSGLVSEDSLETTLASYGTAINFDTEHQKIQLLHNSTVLSEIDASDFIKDSMILNISVTDGTGDNLGQKVLLIDFNTDSGINDIEIPISEFFNPDNYYVKDDFAAVATSGNYNDLSNVPSTLTQEEVNLGTNSDGKLVTAKIIRDSIDSAIIGGNSKVITDDNLSEKVLAKGFAKSVKVGNNLPTIADRDGVLFVPEQKQTDWSENNINDKAYIKNKPTVYNLSEIQNIVKYGQADVSELTDEEKTLIKQENGFVKNSDLPEYEISGNNYVWKFKKNNETVSTITIPLPNEIPTDLSQFNNDVPFLVLSDIENLVESNNVYTKDEINNKIDLISNGSITLNNYYNKTLVNNILNNLPQSDWNLTDNSAKDYIKNKPTIYSQEEILNIIKYGLSDISEMTDELKELAQNTSDFALKSDLFSGDYNDLINKPTESDPIFTASAAYGITTQNIDNWTNKQDSILDLETIRTNAQNALKSTDVLLILNIVNYGTAEPAEGTPQITNITTDNISNYTITNYRQLEYTRDTNSGNIVTEGGSLTLDGTNAIIKISASGNISGISLSTLPENNHSCHLIVKNTATNSISLIINGNTTYVCPEGEINITITKGSYGEVDLLNLDGEIFVRGI